MPEMSEYLPGSFCWVELATTDAEWAKKFYAEIFGWTAVDSPSDMGNYTMLYKDGKTVGGLYQMHPERQEGIPPHWETYVSVTNVDESAAKVKELGGRVVQGPFDVMDLGRTAAVEDPNGAAFILWQPGRNKGAQLIGVPGAYCWSELYTRSTEASIQFYCSLFGWTTKQAAATTGEPYIEFLNGERPIGGMIEIKPEWGPVPPNWSIYFTVANCDATLAKAKSLGADVEIGPMEIEGVGRFAFVKDPQGAYSAIIEMKMQMPDC